MDAEPYTQPVSVSILPPNHTCNSRALVTEGENINLGVLGFSVLRSWQLLTLVQENDNPTGVFWSKRDCGIVSWCHHPVSLREPRQHEEIFTTEVINGMGGFPYSTGPPPSSVLFFCRRNFWCCHATESPPLWDPLYHSWVRVPWTAVWGARAAKQKCSCAAAAENDLWGRTCPSGECVFCILQQYPS